VEYEQCPHRVKLKVIDKIPEPDNKYSVRGTALHAAMESYVRGDTPTLHPELGRFTMEMDALRDIYSQGKAVVEQEWAYDRQWNPADWKSKNAWLRLKLDACAVVKDTGIVIDGKSGKKFGNEIKHAEQGQLYAGVTYLRYPKVKRIVVEFWYFDHDELTQVVYTPQQAAKYLMSFEKRAHRMTTATQFPAKPSIFTCKYCPYRNPDQYGGDGSCKFAAKLEFFPRKK
jgi:CRISPR/Cas system-associated exonuclease Cas4 (RecB family)